MAHKDTILATGAFEATEKKQQSLFYLPGSDQQAGLPIVLYTLETDD